MSNWKGRADPRHRDRRRLLRGLGLLPVCLSAAPWRAALAMDRLEHIPLPAPGHDGDLAVETALLRRRSVRAFAGGRVTLAEVSQLLWAAQGVTHASGFRTAPSAGALYPLSLYMAAGEVESVAAGIYRYRPADHSLARIGDGDRRTELAAAALGQMWIAEAAVALVVAARYSRTTGKYGDRGIRYVHMETGHAAQNVYLQAVALGLGTTVVGAFDDAAVKTVVGLERQEQALALLPIGRV